MRRRVLLLTGAAVVAVAIGGLIVAAFYGDEAEAPDKALDEGQSDCESMAMAAIEGAGLPPGFTHLRTDPLVQDGTPRGALVTYLNAAREIFSVGVSVEASADDASTQYEEFVSHLETLASGRPITLLDGQPSSALVDLQVDRLELSVDSVTTSAIVLRHQPETPEELVSPGIMVVFGSGNVWGRVDVAYRPGTALEEGAEDYAKGAIRAALAAAAP